jgi:hypothetical protein
MMRGGDGGAPEPWSIGSELGIVRPELFGTAPDVLG